VRDLQDIVNDRRLANLRTHDTRVLQLLSLTRLDLIANTSAEETLARVRNHMDQVALILNEGTPNA
jgi:hypothetical protein